MLKLRVEAIKWENSDTATFYLSSTDGKKVYYKAGQFITLIFIRQQKEIRRSYSLSSAPHETLMAITVKRVANGELSRILLTQCRVGDVWQALPPAGRFVLPAPNTAKNIVYFAAGSGITPIYAHLKHLLSRKENNHITLIYSNKTASTTLFYTELTQMAADYADRFTLVYLFSRTQNGLPVQRLNNQLVIALIKQHLKAVSADNLFFLCGPFTYMRMVKLTLLFMGFDEAQIRKENFITEAQPAEGSVINYPPKQIALRINAQTHHILVGQNQTILDAALQNNIPAPYSCKAGICSNCTAICRQGNVIMTVNDVLTDTDLKAGWVLTCTGHPLSDDVVVEFL